MGQFISSQPLVHLNASGSERTPYLQAPETHVVSMSDIDWALRFEKQVHLGVSPSFQEIEKYTAIFNCLEAQHELAQ